MSLPRQIVVLVSALVSVLFCANLLFAQGTAVAPRHPRVYFSDTSRIGRPFAKDPSVIEFHGSYFMYYSLPPKLGTAAGNHGEQAGYGIGIAVSHDLVHWTKAGELTPTQEVERSGIVAPGARVIRGQVHLFYQTYGQGAKDSICHATSTDGLHFTHDPTNPVYRPINMPWSVGRAIDAEVYLNESAGKAYLYFATRDPSMKRQLLGLAQADLSSSFGAGSWTDVTTAGPLLTPELPWEQLCIEAPSVTKHGATLYLFYGGAYNNVPQQIGLATSADGIHWTRYSQHPFLPNGAPGTWNSSESGHPGVLTTHGKTYLFYQGNDDHGKTYWISMVRILWKDGQPTATEPQRLHAMWGSFSPHKLHTEVHSPLASKFRSPINDDLVQAEPGTALGCLCGSFQNRRGKDQSQRVPLHRTGVLHQHGWLWTYV